MKNEQSIVDEWLKIDFLAWNFLFELLFSLSKLFQPTQIKILINEAISSVPFKREGIEGENL